MKVRAIRRQRDECPENARRFIPGNGADITLGTSYEVEAISVFEGITSILIIDDFRLPAWYPSMLFVSEDTSCPHDWLCNLIQMEDGIEQITVIGPGFISGSLASYNEMIELDSDQVTRLWNRIEANSTAPMQ